MIRRAITGALVALFACAVGACSSSPSEGTCVSSKDCPSGQTCLRGQCIAAAPVAECARDTDCDPGEFCTDQGVCQARAGADASTPGNADAAPATGDAAPADDATATLDDGGTAPGDGGTATGDGGAGPGDALPGDAAPACTNDPECTPPSTICIANACVPGCVQNPGLCGAREVCNTGTGRCTPLPTTCAMDSQCAPPATVCENTQCVPGCGQMGGLQCAGATPVCNMTSGRCEPVPPCARDSDCGSADRICVNTACVTRCDRPMGMTCGANTVCNAADGRCIPSNLALGADCATDAQCQSRLCLGLNVNGSARSVCARGCARSLDCPLDFSCLYISGMNFCLSENLFTPPATFDVPVGGACATGNIRCQSGWCNPTAGMCLETCSRESDCATQGNNCFMYTQAGTPNTYDHICVAQTNSLIGATCATNTSCRTGICNRYAQQCAAHCCSDADCPAAQVCGLYDVDTTTGDIVKICGPRTPGAGSLPIGSPCTADTDCDSEVCVAANLASMTPPLQCSTLCCTDADCGQIANGRCVPLGGPTVGPVQTIVGACVSVP